MYSYVSLPEGRLIAKSSTNGSEKNRTISDVNPSSMDMNQFFGATGLQQHLQSTSKPLIVQGKS